MHSYHRRASAKQDLLAENPMYSFNHYCKLVNETFKNLLVVPLQDALLVRQVVHVSSKVGQSLFKKLAESLSS